MGEVRFLLLGPLRVEVGGQEIPLPAGRGRTILATLLANAGEVVPVEELGGASSTPQAVSRLRRVLGEAAGSLRTHGTGYLLHVTNSDLLDFRSLRDQSRYAEALTLWRGRAFEDVEGVRDVAARLDGERRAVEALAPVPHQVPAPPVQFAGRDRELAALRRSGPVTLLSGVGGVGKTTLALQWAKEADFPAGQLHVNLRGFDQNAPARPEEAIRSFLGALGVPPESLPPSTTEQALLYRTLLRGKNMLLLLDNARDADQVRPLLPDDPSCRVVITSRNRMDDLGDTTRVRLDALSPAESHQVLTKRIGARAGAEPEALSRLAARCGGLPLALAIVAARADPQHSLTALADDFADDDVLDFLDTGEETTTVRSVFDWSYERLSVTAQRLFRLLGVHPGPDVSAPAARSLAGTTPALPELVAANLVTETGDGRFVLHDLVHAHARGLVEEDEGRDALHRLLDHYLHSAHHADAELHAHRQRLMIAPHVPDVVPERPDGHDASSRWFAAETGVIIALGIAAAGARLDRYAWQLPWCLTVHMDRSGRWHEWVTVLRSALAAARRLEDDHAAARLHHILAHAHYRLSDAETRDRHLRTALALYERGDLTDGQARVHRSLAQAHEEQGDLAQALHHGRRAVALAASDIERAGALNQVGWFLGLLGRHDEALGQCQNALALHRAGGDKLGEASTLDSIAYNLGHLGDFSGAITHYGDALDLFAAIGEQFEVATTLINLGDAHVATGGADEARHAWEEALEIYERLGHADVAKARERLTALSAASSSA
ncbi:tetratricopeptide repeat protein [Lentzea sp. HUAS12]|uniref:ATP-binding protein n=1 Tax=Lentzea sp. HUAS12 TaxID=2951806 RepID=UPI0020A068BE|nr:tetratricopeptide repeat protein [Lentzea sp. HUAS12]USX52337.1 tetratricopeptide repeat protein [Lentzea sp. HUAS12]